MESALHYSRGTFGLNPSYDRDKDVTELSDQIVRLARWLKDTEDRIQNWPDNVEDTADDLWRLTQRVEKLEKGR